jgi:peptide/nickel transport system permease protein
MKAVGLASRLLHSLVALIAVVSLVWLMFRFIPGDPTTVYLGTGQLTAAAAAEQRAQWGLDAPLWDQYLRYIGNIARGNFGISFLYRRPVMDVLLPAMANTVLLMAPALLIAITLGVSAGAWLGWRRGDKTEAFWSLVVLVPRALPAFWIGMIVLLLFAYHLEWFPIGGMRTPLSTRSIGMKSCQASMWRPI